MASVYDFAATSIEGTPVALESYRGRTLLIVEWPAATADGGGGYEGVDGFYVVMRC